MPANDGSGADEVAIALRAREPIFHRAEFGTSRAVFEAMTASGYWEVGASGTIYDRATVLAVLVERYADPTYVPMAGLELSAFACRPVSGDTWLVTYQLRQEERRSHRMTLWQLEGDQWIALYHQGTLSA
ncbi:MAG: DUF4440 domain-containing protein [Chloroflexota bacterium]